MARYQFRSALVTGASSGIGWEYAKELARRGADLVVVARRTERLHELAEGITNVKVEVLTADLCSEEGVGAVEARLAESPVELLVNNAGMGSGGGGFVGKDATAEADQVRLNVLALVRLTHAAVRPMVEAGKGGILNVSSLAGDQPLRGFVTYAATKAFVSTFTEGLAAELRGTGVHLTLLKPGYVYTEMNPDGPDPKSLAGRFWLTPDVVAKASLDAVERGRMLSVPGLHYRAASGLVNALPHQLVRALSSRVDASG
ncbi:MAG TPA: SDR family NAD(P)-dependent oxidoreductase [Mycobacteriales bacterium]|nr:SDR family NAD(P)-dependent oxidoreductase [Mycobacteriales bacterium]